MSNDPQEINAAKIAPLTQEKKDRGNAIIDFV